MSAAGKRRKSRELAMQMLFQADVGKQTEAQVRQNFWTAREELDGVLPRADHGDPVRTHRIMDLGVFPWWTDPILKAEFLQALTVCTHRLDYVLWPDSPALMHAQSLFWLGASLAAVAVFYRRMLGPTAVAATAALLYGRRS